MNEINMPVQVVGSNDALHVVLREVWAAAARAGSGGFVRILVNNEVATLDGKPPEPGPTKEDTTAAIQSLEDLGKIADGLRRQLNDRTGELALAQQAKSELATQLSGLNTQLEELKVALGSAQKELAASKVPAEPVVEKTTAPRRK